LGAQGLPHQEALAFYGQFTGAGDLVFDVGAMVGNRTKLFLGLGARVAPSRGAVGSMKAPRSADQGRCA